MAVTQADLNNPRIRQFLDFLSAAEGTTGYNAGFGGRKLSSLADHPRTLFDFKNKSGVTKKTSAAGRYQITRDTWDEFAKKAGVKDFSPASQDRVALAIIDQAGALDDIRKGDYNKATGKLGTRWASLPSSKYDQPSRSQKFVDNFFGNSSASPSPRNTVAGRPVIPPSMPLSAATQNVMRALSQNQGQGLPGVIGAAAQGAYPLLRPLITTGSGLPQMDANLASPNTWQDLLPKQTSANPYQLGDTNNEPWEDDFMQSVLSNQADNIRNRDVSAFLGQPHVDDRPLPAAIEKALTKLVALI